MREIARLRPADPPEEALLDRTGEEILALAAKDSPEVAKAFEEKWRSVGQPERDALYERMLADRDRFPIPIRSGMWHNLTAWALAMIADDAFMIHETIGFHLDIKDSIPMLMLGVWLLIILAIHRNRMVRGFWYCFGVFLVPFGDEIIPPLQAITAEIAIALTLWSGVPAQIDGIYIDTPVGLFIVAEACSGAPAGGGTRPPANPPAAPPHNHGHPL